MSLFSKAVMFPLMKESNIALDGGVYVDMFSYASTEPLASVQLCLYRPSGTLA